MQIQDAQIALKARRGIVGATGPNLILDELVARGWEVDFALLAAEGAPSIHSDDWRGVYVHVDAAVERLPLLRLRALADRHQTRFAGRTWEEWEAIRAAAPAEEREACALIEAAQWVDKFGHERFGTDRTSAVAALAALKLAPKTDNRE